MKINPEKDRKNCTKGNSEKNDENSINTAGDTYSNNQAYVERYLNKTLWAERQTSFMNRFLGQGIMLEGYSTLR